MPDPKPPSLDSSLKKPDFKNEQNFSLYADSPSGDIFNHTSQEFQEGESIFGINEKEGTFNLVNKRQALAQAFVLVDRFKGVLTLLGVGSPSPDDYRVEQLGKVEKDDRGYWRITKKLRLNWGKEVESAQPAPKAPETQSAQARPMQETTEAPQIETHTVEDFEQAVVNYLYENSRNFKTLINFEYKPEDTDVSVEVFYKNKKGDKSSVQMSAAEIFEQSLDKKVSQVVMLGNNFLVTFKDEAPKTTGNEEEVVMPEPEASTQALVAAKSENEIKLEKLEQRKAEIAAIRAELLKKLKEAEKNKK